MYVVSQLNDNFFSDQPIIPSLWMSIKNYNRVKNLPPLKPTCVAMSHGIHCVLVFSPETWTRVWNPGFCGFENKILICNIAEFVGQFLNMYMSGGTHNTLCVHRITSHQIDYSWEKFPAEDKWIQVAHSHNMFFYSGPKKPGQKCHYLFWILHLTRYLGALSKREILIQPFIHTLIV